MSKRGREATVECGDVGVGDVTSAEAAPDLSHMPAGLTDDERRVWALAEVKMARMVGQDEIKERLRTLLTVVMNDRRRGGDQYIHHMCITGPSAVARTMLARMIGDLLRDLEVVNGQFMKVSGKDLEGNKVYDALKECEGGILFIDGAHALDTHKNPCRLLVDNLYESGFVCRSESGWFEDRGYRFVINTLVITAGGHNKMLRWLDDYKSLSYRFKRGFPMDATPAAAPAAAPRRALPPSTSRSDAPVPKRRREPTPTADDATDTSTALSFVYGLLFLPSNAYIYIGSTDEFDVREGAHFSYRGNARRVAIVFAQKWFQPLRKFFQLDKLWAGRVEDKAELRAIEQYFMNKHGTRLEYRSREPTLSKDLDLMDESVPPRQLNINRACADLVLVAAAAARVQHDLQLAVVPTEREQMKVAHMSDYLWCAATTVERAVPVLLRELIAKYRDADGAHRISVTEVHGDLVRVRNAATDEDGSDFHWLLKAELVKFSTDRNADGTWPPRMIAGVFAALVEAQGVDLRTPSIPASTTRGASVEAPKRKRGELTPKEAANWLKKMEDLHTAVKAMEGSADATGRRITLLGDIIHVHKSAYNEMYGVARMFQTQWFNTMDQLKDFTDRESWTKALDAVQSKCNESHVRDYILRCEITDIVVEYQSLCDEHEADPPTRAACGGPGRGERLVF